MPPFYHALNVRELFTSPWKQVLNIEYLKNLRNMKETFGSKLARKFKKLHTTNRPQLLIEDAYSRIMEEVSHFEIKGVEVSNK